MGYCQEVFKGTGKVLPKTQKSAGRSDCAWVRNQPGAKT